MAILKQEMMPTKKFSNLHHSLTHPFNRRQMENRGDYFRCSEQIKFLHQNYHWTASKFLLMQFNF
jgi:hypothetical protein